MLGEDYPRIMVPLARRIGGKKMNGRQIYQNWETLRVAASSSATNSAAMNPYYYEQWKLRESPFLAFYPGKNYALGEKAWQLLQQELASGAMGSQSRSQPQSQKGRRAG
jgi:hypothetical protein